MNELELEICKYKFPLVWKIFILLLNLLYIFMLIILLSANILSISLIFPLLILGNMLYFVLHIPFRLKSNGIIRFTTNYILLKSKEGSEKIIWDDVKKINLLFHKNYPYISILGNIGGIIRNSNAFRSFNSRGCLDSIEINKVKYNILIKNKADVDLLDEVVRYCMKNTSAAKLDYID